MLYPIIAYCTRSLRPRVPFGLSALTRLAGVVAVSGVPQSGSASDGIDLPELISKSDLHYSAPIERSENGLPVGNGRMGSLVWHTPTALKFQINRVDLHPVHSGTTSFFERHSDTAGGAGFVDIDLGGAGVDVFTDEDFSAHLSVYDALLGVHGRDVDARIIAWHEQDVMAVEIDDRRDDPQPIQVNLRMLRFLSQYYGGRLEEMIENRVVTVRTRNHTAASRLIERDGRIILTQEFSEHGHYASSAVAIAIVGRDARTRFANPTEVRLEAPAGNSRFTIFIASAATLERDKDVVAAALGKLDAAERVDFDELVRDNAEWWRQFWELGFVSLESEDGVAEYIVENYHYFLYLMGSASRGAFPVKFNGMLWNTAGDLQPWGAQHWFANFSCYYEALPASNRLELMDPAFEMFTGMFDAAARAAREHWGSQGIFIPETFWFDGLAPLPEDIAEEMRELYLLRKPWQERSDRFMEYAATRHPHSSRWNWKDGGRWVEGRWEFPTKMDGPFGHVTHIMGTTAKVAYLYWRQYEYTLDEDWLRARAYPMLEGAAEFYRHFPNLKKGDDGLYHIHHVNSNESVWGARNTDEDMSAMRGVLAAAIRASEILDEDPTLRESWVEMLENLAPLPRSDHPDALRRLSDDESHVWVRGLHPAARGAGFRPDHNSMPMWFFDLANLESADVDRLSTAHSTFDGYFSGGITENTDIGVLSKLAIAGATLGREDATRHLIANQMRVMRAERGTAYRGGQRLDNRLTLREGPQAFDAQHLGRASEALHMALLQSTAPGPGEDPILRVFAAWPPEWNATFRLRARGAFIVTASHRDGEVEYVDLYSEAGALCRLRNPWGDTAVILNSEGASPRRLSGSLLEFRTEPEQRIRLVRR